MTNLLYHWNFTGSNDLGLEEAIYDSESSLVAKVKRRGSYSNSNFSRSTDGIFLNNNDGESGGYYIDLEGLNTVQLGGNISFEMAVKNNDRTIKAIYFLSVGEDAEVNQAFINFRYNGLAGKEKTFFSVRTDEKNDLNGVSYTNRVTSESSNTVITSNNEFHFIFSLHYDSSGSSIKIYIDGDKKGENNADLEKALTTDARNTNFIGTRKLEGEGVTYLNGVVKFLKIYQNSTSDSEATSIYNNYNNSVYWSNYSSMSNSNKYTRRHSEVSTYFENNSSLTKFNIQGNQLGLSNGPETYTIHKFTSGDTISITDTYNYIPLEGLNNFIILNYNSTYYKITQTSILSNESSKYKCEVSLENPNNFNLETQDKGFSDTFDHQNTQIVFGGVEFNTNNEICFHENTIINTDQGEVLIKDLTSNHTIENHEIIYLIKSPNKPKKLVLIKKNSLEENIPDRDIILTKSHLIYYQDKVQPISNLIDDENIICMNNKNSNFYNIILLNKNYIRVNQLNLNVFGIDSKYLHRLESMKQDGIKEFSVFFPPTSNIKIELEKIKNF